MAGDDAKAQGRDARMYASPAEGLSSLAAGYNYWTGKITESSFQVCMALIAANWIVNPTREKLLNDHWSLASVLVVLFALAVNLLGSWWMAQIHYKEFYDAQRDRDGWKDRWESSESALLEWPFSQELQCRGKLLVLAKVFLPLISGALLMISVLES